MRLKDSNISFQSVEAVFHSAVDAADLTVWFVNCIFQTAVLQILANSECEHVLDVKTHACSSLLKTISTSSFQKQTKTSGIKVQWFFFTLSNFFLS